MNLQATLEALRPRVSLTALRQGGGEPFAVQVTGGPHLELRYLETLDALAMALPLGHLVRTRLREAGLRLLLSNLYLADAGRPHYALDPQDGLVCLCRTVPVQQIATADLLHALQSLLAAWAPTRAALQDLQVIAS